MGNGDIVAIPHARVALLRPCNLGVGVVQALLPVRQVPRHAGDGKQNGEELGGETERAAKIPNQVFDVCSHWSERRDIEEPLHIGHGTLTPTSW